MQISPKRPAIAFRPANIRIKVAIQAGQSALLYLLNRALIAGVAHTQLRVHGYAKVCWLADIEHDPERAALVQLGNHGGPNISRERQLLAANLAVWVVDLRQDQHGDMPWLGVAGRGGLSAGRKATRARHPWYGARQILVIVGCHRACPRAQVL